MTVRVTVFLEVRIFSCICFISQFLCAKYAGWFGAGGVVYPFSKLNTTEDMNGLSSGFSCTHKSPIWMQSEASSCKQFSSMHSSIKSFAFPSFQRLHAWNSHITRWYCIKKYSKLFTLWNNEICLHRLLGLGNSVCDPHSLSLCHLQPPILTHQSYRHQISQRKCPPLHTQEPCNHW